MHNSPKDSYIAGLSEALPGLERCLELTSRTRQMLERIVALLGAHGKSGGDLVYCPICRSLLTHFVDFRGRQNAQCPICRCLERHRFSALVIEDRIPGRQVPRTLHFAPEPVVSVYLKALTTEKYVTADLFSPKVDIQCDIADTPFEDGEFDIIYCSHVLEHVPHDRVAMKELLRILRPGGVALIMVPIGKSPTDEDPEKAATPELRRLNYGQEDHVRRYGLDIVDRLEEAGFQVDLISTSDPAYKLPMAKFGLMANDYVFWATRPLSSEAAG